MQNINNKDFKSFLIISHYSGIPKYGPIYRHFDIAKELVNNGHKVSIVAASNSHLRDTPVCKVECVDGVSLIWVTTPKYNNYGFKRFMNMFIFSLNLFFYNKYLPLKPDFIIVSSPSPFPVLNAIYLKFKHKSKLIYEIRDVWPKSIIELKGISQRNIIIKFIDKLDDLGLKYSDFILSPLSNIKLYIKEKYINKKIIILRNGIPSTNIVTSKLDNKIVNNFIIGYGGKLTDGNSVMNLIDAAIILKQHNNIKFKIVGFGELELPIKQIIKTEELNNIELHGRKSKEELFDILSSCDILYKGNPTKSIYKYGISSLKLVEYLLLKKPVIDASDGDDLVSVSNSGFSIENENPEKLANLILNIKDIDSEVLEKKGNNGYEYVCNNYLYSNTVPKMLSELLLPDDN